MSASTVGDLYKRAQELKGICQQKKLERAELEGRLKGLKEQLQSQHGLSSLEEAEDRLKGIDEERLVLEKEATRLGTHLDEIEGLLGA